VAAAPPVPVGVTATDLLTALRDRGQTLAVAESLTGGLLAAGIVDVPGSSTVFRGGVVAYASDLKESVLGVPAEVVEGSGVVSVACAEAMALGVRRLLGADWALSTTGVAGPDPQEGHPAGTVFVGLAGPDGVLETLALVLEGDRAAVRSSTVTAALDRLAAILGVRPGNIGPVG